MAAGSAGLHGLHALRQARPLDLQARRALKNAEEVPGDDAAAFLFADFFQSVAESFCSNFARFGSQYEMSAVFNEMTTLFYHIRVEIRRMLPHVCIYSFEMLYLKLYEIIRNSRSYDPSLMLYDIVNDYS